MQIGSLIRRAALHYKDAPCLAEGDRILSFREIDKATDRLGNALIAKGQQPGDRVGAQCYGRAESPMAITYLRPNSRLARLPKSAVNKILRRSVRDTLVAQATEVGA